MYKCASDWFHVLQNLLSCLDFFFLIGTVEGWLFEVLSILHVYVIFFFFIIVIQAGADPNLGSCGKTPLIAAACEGETEIINCLLKSGADPNARDNVNCPVFPTPKTSLCLSFSAVFLTHVSFLLLGLSFMQELKIYLLSLLWSIKLVLCLIVTDGH